MKRLHERRAMLAAAAEAAVAAGLHPDTSARRWAPALGLLEAALRARPA